MMEDMELIKNCIVNNCNEKNTFVGIKYENGNIEIRFPFGYRLSKEHIREDILLLLEVLSNNTKQIKSNIVDNVYNINDRYHKVDFPIQAYIFIIKDFYRRGYYKEYNIDYKVGKNGKINWNRTIKTQKKYIQKNDVFYLDFVVKSNRINENQIITMIHEYCVYESFKKIGWLFNKFVLKKPRIKKCLKLFLSILYNKIQNTFNNNNKFLFKNMIDILEYESNHIDEYNYKYGTERFEYIWENMIDKVYGIKNKKKYFPKTYWNIKGNIYNNSVLEPDTIMIYDNNVYVLDAKYYKYGISGNKKDLPNSSSINKQITYGEYIAKNIDMLKKYENSFKVYNAFLMPYESKEINEEKYKWIGEAYSEWKNNSKEYERIQGILIDVKYLMSLNNKYNLVEISKISKIIKNNFKEVI